MISCRGILLLVYYFLLIDKIKFSIIIYKSNLEQELQAFTSLAHQRRRLSSNSPASAASIRGSSPWARLVSKMKAAFPDINREEVDCTLPETAKVQLSTSSISISNLLDFKPYCILNLIEIAALDTSVLRIVAGTRPRLFNFEVRGLLQSGTRFNEPYGDAGLDGEGQIIGIADSGLNDLSCFFIDDTDHYSTVVTDRTGVIEPLRRKVIQYVGSVDGTDDEGGHGTHVCGTVAGFSAGASSASNGVAPAAKIAFYDIGNIL